MRRKAATAIMLTVALCLTSCASMAQNNVPPTPTPIKHGWYTILDQNFNQAAPLGQIEQVYGANMRGYTNGHRDTTGKGMYAPEQVLSVHDGVLDWYVHTTPAGQPVTAAPAPQGYTGQRYGRWSLRFRSDYLPGYKLAFLLWPDSNHWPDGEIDFPEGELGSEISGFSHDITGDPSHNIFKYDTGLTMSSWHTVEIEWLPGKLTYTIDGVSKTTTDPRALPTTTLHQILQVETSLDGPTPEPAVAGHVQVDWLKIEGYNP